MQTQITLLLRQTLIFRCLDPSDNNCGILQNMITFSKNWDSEIYNSVTVLKAEEFGLKDADIMTNSVEHDITVFLRL